MDWNADDADVPTQIKTDLKRSFVRQAGLSVDDFFDKN